MIRAMSCWRWLKAKRKVCVTLHSVTMTGCIVHTALVVTSTGCVVNGACSHPADERSYVTYVLYAAAFFVSCPQFDDRRQLTPCTLPSTPPSHRLLQRCPVWRGILTKISNSPNWRVCHAMRYGSVAQYVYY